MLRVVFGAKMKTGQSVFISDFVGTEIHNVKLGSYSGSLPIVAKLDDDSLSRPSVSNGWA